MKSQKHTQLIKTEAKRLGFDFCGISKAGFLEEEAPHLEKWLKANMHGQMQYMENYFDKRLDPTLLVEGAKSVVSLLFNYYPEQTQNPDAPKISKYAYGNDYHEIIKEKLKEFVYTLKEQIGDINGRVFVDSAPVLEEGPSIESHPAFPNKVNAGYMQVLNRNEIKLRVFERGAGETLACGTGACAAVVSGIRRALLDSPVTVHTRGGDLQIAWAGMIDDVAQPVIMTGPAITVFEGETVI